MEKVSEQEKSVTVETKRGDRFNTSSVSCCREFISLKSSKLIRQP